MSLLKAPRLEPHTLSDSDQDVPVVTKKKKVPQKRKMATRSTECPSMSDHMAQATSAQAQLATQASLIGGPSVQEASELLEMRSLCKEIKSLTERFAAYMERARQEVGAITQPQPVYVLEGEPNIDQ